MADRVNASSFLGLKAELHAARHRTLDAQAQRLQQKPLSLGKKPRGEKRAPDTVDDTETQRHKASRAALERKARMYTKLREGKHGGLDTRGDALVDWDATLDTTGAAADASDDAALDPADALVEYTDEFGRTRMDHKSNTPVAYRESSDAHDMPEENAIYGPATAFPVYKKEARTLPVATADKDESLHFDPDWEIRSRGAAFYRFAHDKAARRAQQTALGARRAETEARRAEAPHTVQPRLGSQRRAARQAVVDAQYVLRFGRHR
ncbi:hypothetical protein MVES1_000213 [Malassezia vespertilionis]|uniref:uncharacterized protein n=1 Tax=Malassezia vespertilionis TaxID=2020962 RepID=UPI0024B0E797|nr:uncharacterized protein MVES1_000213 [Malassezia vespertilionis]WFD04888.1 hypothetical protein MVES1_000213 [Malassezia vespertilionis]